MNIAAIHNYYQIPGGEDSVYQNEIEALKRRGHNVSIFTMHNDDIESQSRLRVAKETVWSRRSYQSLFEFFQRNRIDVAHFHNTFPLISPSGYYAAKSAGAAVVQTLHNFRLVCPGGQFLRAGRICEDCNGRTFPLPGIVHGCYRGERGATSVVASMLAFHWLRGTWKNQVDCYVVLSEFAKSRFIVGGLPADKIVVKPNFADAPAITTAAPRQKRALFVGRLSKEKGIDTLLEAWNELQTPLDVIGGGTLLESVKRANVPSISIKGQMPPDKVAEAMSTACFLVVPSICYEGFPLVIAEAMAAGLPVIASRLGAMAEIVQDGVTGLHFNAGDAGDLASKVRWAINNGDDMARMGDNAREIYHTHYTESINYEQLISIYEKAIERASTKSNHSSG